MVFHIIHQYLISSTVGGVGVVGGEVVGGGGVLIWPESITSFLSVLVVSHTVRFYR